MKFVVTRFWFHWWSGTDSDNGLASNRWQAIVWTSSVNFYHNWPQKATWFRKVARRQTSDRPLHETMFSIRSDTSNTPEGTIVMRSIIIQYGTQWLRVVGINRRVLTRDTHKSVRVGVSAVKFHKKFMFLLFFIYVYCRIYTWWNSRLLHNITR